MKLIIPHLAIPSRDLNESKEFYEKLGCEIGRCTEDSVIVNFFGTQLVLHKSLDYDRMVTMYPRHYGLVLDSKDAYYALHVIHEGHKKSSFVHQEMFTRGEGLFHEHKTFFLLDPSNNLIEFKAYKNSKSIFGVDNG